MCASLAGRYLSRLRSVRPAGATCNMWEHDGLHQRRIMTEPGSASKRANGYGTDAESVERIGAGFLLMLLVETNKNNPDIAGQQHGNRILKMVLK